MTEVPFQANFVVVYDLFHLRGCGSLCLKLRYLAEIFFKKNFSQSRGKKDCFCFRQCVMFTFQLACQFKDARIIYNLGFYEKISSIRLMLKDQTLLAIFVIFCQDSYSKFN